MDFAKHVRESVDIVRVVGEYVRLKKAASGRFVGLCPFHTEKTPSFSVNSNFQIFICFGCGKKGDLFTFLMEIEGLSFVEALHAVAERNGIPIPVRRERGDPEAQIREVLLGIHEVAAEVFRTNLRGPSGSDARAYVVKRGISPKLAEEFGLGFAERTGQDLCRKLQKQFPPDQLEASGLVLKRQDGSFFDRFRGRLMFPIHSHSGKVIAFGGRALYEGDEVKYLNSPETPLYHKSSTVYNLHRAKQAIRKNDSVVLVEGYMDVIGVYSAGVHHVVASCGTALTAEQIKAVRNHSEHIVVNFDPDEAGANATEQKLQMLLDEGMNVRVLQLEGGLDPDEYVKTHGAEQYEKRLRAAPGYFIWMADRARQKFDMATAEGRIAGLDFLRPSIRRISHEIERALVADEVASYLGLERDLVLDEFRKSAVQRKNRQQRPVQQAVSLSERVLLKSLIADREVRDVLIPSLKTSKAVKNFVIQPILYIVCTLHESDPDFSYSDVEGRLDEKGKQVLASAVLGDHSDELLSVEQASAYLRVLENDDRLARVTEMRAHIREAERRGEMERAFQLIEELNRLQRG